MQIGRFTLVNRAKHVGVCDGFEQPGLLILQVALDEPEGQWPLFHV